MLNEFFSKKSKKEVYIYKYISLLLYYTSLFTDEHHKTLNYTKKSEASNLMLRADVDGGLSSMDIEFFDILSEIELELATNKEHTNVLYGHREFVEKHLNINVVPNKDPSNIHFKFK